MYASKLPALGIWAERAGQYEAYHVVYLITIKEPNVCANELPRAAWNNNTQGVALAKSTWRARSKQRACTLASKI